jgi:hypothetical protein
VGFREGQILKLHQARLNPLITVILGPEHRKRDGLGARARNSFRWPRVVSALTVMRVFILPSCPKLGPGSDSLHGRNTPPVQTHVILEETLTSFFP